MTWDFPQRAQAFLRPGVRVLYLGRESPEWLLARGHPFPLLSLALGPEDFCQWGPVLKRLGCQAALWQGGPLPYGDGCFDLVLHRWGPCPYEEMRRVLRSGGFCLTEQQGAQDGQAQGLPPDYNLENQGVLFQQAGFHIRYQAQDYAQKEGRLSHRFILVGKAA